jgi:hypothetical protein
MTIIVAVVLKQNIMLVTPVGLSLRDFTHKWTDLFMLVGKTIPGSQLRKAGANSILRFIDVDVHSEQKLFRYAVVVLIRFGNRRKFHDSGVHHPGLQSVDPPSSSRLKPLFFILHILGEPTTLGTS